MRKWACQPLAVLLMVLLLGATITATERAPYRMAATTPPATRYTLTFQGYDFDGANEETIAMNGALVATVPPVLTTANGGSWISFTFNITSFVVNGLNNVSFTHANFDCPYSDLVQNLIVSNQTSTIYSNATVENVNTPTNCTNTLTYAFMVDATPPPTNYVLSFQGYDFDGANEETIALNGNFVTSIPSVLSPQNGGVWVSFTVSIPDSFITQGMNNLVFTHANSDCLYDDGVRNLQLLANNTVILSDASSKTINCTTRVTYTFEVSPTVIGWGGVRLDESQANSANPPSQVFFGEAASSMELQAQRLQARGFNAIRVSFQSACSSSQEMGAYNSTWLNRAIAIAQHYGFWIIVDYHGSKDLTNSTGVSCWLGYWNPIVQQFMNAYSRTIWEPINEPSMANNTDVASLSNAYQQWINQARGLGDTHWIVVQNLCSSNCGFSNMADGYPTVNDTQGRVFISLHSYMGYQYYSSSWNNATAESLAQQFYNAVVSGSERTGWPVLNTEGGADPQQTNCSGGVSLPSSQCAPDQVQCGSAGYSNTTFPFIQALTSLYDSNTPQRINWLWWPMGSWTDTPLAEPQYGALSNDGWGSLLQYPQVPPQNNPSLGLDGIGVNNCQQQFCQQSQLLTTTQSNDVIIVVVETSGGTNITSVTDNNSLTFTERISYTSQTEVSGGFGGNQTLWEYYAIAPSPLNSDNITVVGDKCCYSVLGMQTFAISGANTVGVFDPNPSITATVSCPGTGCGNCTANFRQGTCSAFIQTSTTDFVVASTAINDAGPCGPSSPGFNNITNQNGRFEVDYTITTMSQTTVEFDCNGTDAVAIVVDAIMASSL